MVRVFSARERLRTEDDINGASNFARYISVTRRSTVVIVVV